MMTLIIFRKKYPKKLRNQSFSYMLRSDIVIGFNLKIQGLPLMVYSENTGQHTAECGQQH